MSKQKIKKIDVTADEIIAIKDAADTLVGMAGGGNDDLDDEARRFAMHIDELLKRNGLKPREYR